MSRIATFALLLAAANYGLLGAALSAATNARVRLPYMDELFHVAQAQRYCAGRWREWDDKITTLPGLYLLAAPYARLVALLRSALPAQLGGAQAAAEAAAAQLAGAAGAESNAADLEAQAVCSLGVLRSVNVALGVLVLLLLHALLRRLHPHLRPLRAVLLAAQLALCPPLFFFLYLFYTDLLALAAVLATYLAHLSGRPALAAALGVAAVLARQTNAVWLAFFVLESLQRSWSTGDSALFGVAQAQDANAASAHAAALHSGGDKAGTATPPAVEGEKEAKIARAAVWLYQPQRWADVPAALAHMVLACAKAAPRIAVRHAGLLLACAAFAAFVVLNGGSVVVGDRSNHTFSVHLPQLLYFVLFTAALCAPTWLSVATARDAVRAMARNKVATLLWLAVMAVAIRYCTIEHPFLLADNRHYPFYVWKNLYRRWAWFRFAAAPVYLLAGWLLLRLLASAAASRHKLWQLLFGATAALLLVPTPLLEPRYFLAPALMLLLHAAPSLTASVPRALLSIAAYALVNAATIALFLLRPFTWPDGSEARFMW